MRRPVALATLLITLAVGLPLLAWGLAGRDAAWRAANRIERAEVERQRRLAESAAERVALGLHGLLAEEAAGRSHRWVAARITSPHVAADGLPPGDGTGILGATIDGRPEIVAARRVDGRLELLVLDRDAMEREMGIRLRAVGSETSARVPLPEAGRLAWTVSVPDGGAVESARERGRGKVRDFDRSYAIGATLAVIAWGLALAVLALSLRAERERARLAAVAAHELRTPLTSLLVHAELLAGAPGLDESSRRQASLVAEEAERLGRTVTNVLDGARLERGALVVLPRAGDLAAAVRAEVERLRAGLERRGVAVEVTGPPDGLVATFDPDALAHVLGNLLDNAARHGTRAGRGRVEVDVRARPGGAVIEVRDDGPGLRAGSSTRGLGLGLSIARRLARAQGGGLELVETPGGGVTARVTLPG